MQNELLARHLEQISDYYLVAQDLGRMRSFRTASRSVSLLPSEITQSNFNQIKFKGLGDSILQIIKQFTESQRSDRLDELQSKYPPLPVVKSLLRFYNMDLQYIQHLWSTYQIKSISDLGTIPEVRANEALANYQPSYTSLLDNQPTTYSLLGDCFIQTAFGSGRLTIDEIVEKLIDMGDKHLFIADNIQGPNVLGGLEISRIMTQREAIKEAQIKHNVRIWHGGILDLDLDGNFRLTPQIINSFEFIVIKLSTSPHTNIVQRITKALSSLSKRDNVIIDCLDQHCLKIDIDQFNQLLQIYNPIVLLSPQMDQDSRAMKRLLSGTTYDRFALGSCATTEVDFSRLAIAASIAKTLDIREKSIINCLPKPFSRGKVAENRVGVRNSDLIEAVGSQPEARLENFIQKVEQLRKTKNPLDALRKDKK